MSNLPYILMTMYALLHKDMTSSERKECFKPFDHDSDLGIATSPKRSHEMAFCILQQAHIMTPKGEISKPNLEKLLQRNIPSQDQVEKAIKLCNKQEQTPQKTAYALAQCLIEEGAPYLKK